MTFTPSGRSPRTERLAALILLLAFAGAAWKIASRAPSADFAVPTPVTPSAAAAGVTGGVNKPAPLERSPDGRFQFSADFVSSAAGKAVHAASLVELSGGRLQAVWFSGSREGAGDVAIQTAVLDPATASWSAERTLFDRTHLQQGLWRYVKKLGNPVIARAPDGSLYLWMVTVSLGGWAGSSITWSRSADEGVNWTAPRRLVTSPFINISTLVKGAPIAYANGDIGLPVYHEFVAKFGEVLRLSPQGQLLDKTRITGSRGDLQPVMLVQDATRAQVYLRSGQATALMASSTDDAGRHWSPARATAWPNPDSALAGVVTRSGAQWLALNPNPRNREVLALLSAPVGQSIDGVQPWVVESSATPQTRSTLAAYEQLLTQELKRRGASDEQARADVASARRQLCGPQTCSQEFSYPYLLQGSDGALHLVYTWHRTRIKHVRLDPLQALAPAAAQEVAP